MRPNQAVVDVNAFAYASSIHQDGALKTETLMKPCVLRTRVEVPTQLYWARLLAVMPLNSAAKNRCWYAKLV